MNGFELIDGLMADPLIADRVKIENYLLVYLGLRPCSQITLPAELPDGKTFGADIDERTYPLLSGVRAETDPRRKLKAIEDVKREMRIAFKEIIEASKQYHAHLKWGKALGLQCLRAEVRPTVQELYLFKEREVKKRLKRLMKDRESLRRQVMHRPPPSLGRVQLAYPEEFHGGWIRNMGELLGYPACCAEQYASDREGGIAVEERASQQIKEAGQHGAIDAFAYFVGYYFPCSPSCDSAITRGRECHTSLNDIDPKLGEIYTSIVGENRDRVLRQPEIIAEHRARAMESSCRREE